MSLIRFCTDGFHFWQVFYPWRLRGLTFVELSGSYLYWSPSCETPLSPLRSKLPPARRQLTEPLLSEAHSFFPSLPDDEHGYELPNCSAMLNSHCISRIYVPRSGASC